MYQGLFDVFERHEGAGFHLTQILKGERSKVRDVLTFLGCQIVFSPIKTDFPNGGEGLLALGKIATFSC